MNMIKAYISFQIFYRYRMLHSLIFLFFLQEFKHSLGRRRRHLQQGKALSELHYRAPWYPLVPALGFVLCLVACVGLAFDPSQRIALWCGIPFVALCYGAYYLTRSRKLTQEPQHVAE